MNFEIEGLDGVIQTLDKLSGKETVHSAIMDGLMDAGKLIQQTAKNICPVDTGQLRNSIEVTSVEDKVEIGTNVEYAPYVEYGTGYLGDSSVPHTKKESWVYRGADGNFYTSHGQSPQPFLYPAFNAHITTIKTKVKESLQNGIKRAVK